VIRVVSGDSPVILAMPHGSTFVPENIFVRLNARGQQLVDTDWHIAQLYEGLLPSATTVAAQFHRYVIDANRGPDDVSLYPGQNTTGLCPMTDFDGQPIWQDAPDQDEIAARCHHYHAPYHAALSDEIDRVRARHGVVILFDCHSIRSQIPYLFDGQLPIFNIGTNGGDSCAATVAQTVFSHCFAPKVLNGRFKGGWTTRHYGAGDVHAVQMEIAQRAYLTAEAAPWTFDPKTAVRPILGQILTSLDTLARSGHLTGA
jgi:N-formylglutamate deformylase